MRLLFFTDLHGDLDQYQRMISVCRSQKPDIVILGGDMLRDDSALEPARMGRGQPEWVQGEFRQAVCDLRDAGGCEHVLTIFGNHDWSSSVEAMRTLAADGILTVLTPDQTHTACGLNFTGYSSTPPTPWFVKDFERLDMPGDTPPLLGGARWNARFSRATTHPSSYLFDDNPTMSDELATATIADAPWVFVAHSPPFESKLDRSRHNDPWGSKAVRTFIEKHQPMLSLHGHIHDSPTTTGTCQETFGRTVGVNPGQLHGALCYAAITIDVAAEKVTQVEHGQER